jgi:hypothetical protein
MATGFATFLVWDKAGDNWVYCLHLWHKLGELASWASVEIVAEASDR